MTLATTSAASLRLKASAAPLPMLTALADASEPPAPPLPSCSVPAEIVVPPVYRLPAARTWRPLPALTRASVPLTPFWMAPENVPLLPVFPREMVSLFWSDETMPLPFKAPRVYVNPLAMPLFQLVLSLPASSHAPLSVRSAAANWAAVLALRPMPPPLTTTAPENAPALLPVKHTPPAAGGVAVATPVVLNDR